MPRTGNGTLTSSEALAMLIRTRVRHSQYHITRILIVDDARDFAHGIKEFLRRHANLNVGVVTSSKEAYTQIKRANRANKPFQLIISDLQLGIGDDTGLKILAEARKLCPDIRTILMSSIASTSRKPYEHADFTLHKDTHDMLTNLLLLIDRLEISIAMQAMEPLTEPRT